jgi:hypothetical protein
MLHPTQTTFAKKLKAYNNRSDASKKTLYAVVYEIYEKRNPDPIAGKIHYVQADDAAEARYHFRRSYPNHRRYRMSAVAPVIGYFVEDKEGKILSA